MAAQSPAATFRPAGSREHAKPTTITAEASTADGEKNARRPGGDRIHADIVVIVPSRGRNQRLLFEDPARSLLAAVEHAVHVEVDLARRPGRARADSSGAFRRPQTGA